MFCCSAFETQEVSMLINNNPNWQKKILQQRGNSFSKLHKTKQGSVGKCYYGNENAGDMAHKC